MPFEQTSPLGPWPEGILPVHCSECRLPLCIGMPREAFPKRLVGACVGCRAKYVVAWTADGTEALIGRLPDVEGGEPPRAYAVGPAHRSGRLLTLDVVDEALMFAIGQRPGAGSRGVVEERDARRRRTMAPIPVRAPTYEKKVQYLHM